MKKSIQLPYPPIEARHHDYLVVDDIHSLYFEECGNPKGIPVLFLHNGPGSGFQAASRQFFDPTRYRIILFDQRGSGHSKPHTETKNNTTQHLIEDIENLRQYLHIKKWVLLGEGWGSTLALAYAQMHSKQVLTLILQGIFLCIPQDIKWAYQVGANHIYPDYWQEFISPIPISQQNHLIDAYYKILTNNNDIARMNAAKSWALWKGRIASINSNPNAQSEYTETHTALGVATLSTYYLINQGFFEPQQLINHCHMIKDIPGFIIHGRHDMTCPLSNAYQLSKSWPKAELIIEEESGHNMYETAMASEIVKVTDKVADRWYEEPPGTPA